MNIADIAAAASVAGIMAVAVGFYHEQDQGALKAELAVEDKVRQEQMDNVETNAVVDRIMRIQEGRCDNKNLQRIVQEQMARYHDLTGREFGLVACTPTPETQP